MAGNDDLLKIELTELNSFVRHHIQLYLAWYSFFLTVNFGAIGWFTSVLLTGALKQSLPVIFVAIFFMVQIILSYIGSREVLNYFVITSNRSCEILNSLETQPPDPNALSKSAIPIKVYSKLLSLICATLISFVFFWLALTVVALYLVPL